MRKETRWGHELHTVDFLRREIGRKRGAKGDIDAAQSNHMANISSSNHVFKLRHANTSPHIWTLSRSLQPPSAYLPTKLWNECVCVRERFPHIWTVSTERERKREKGELWKKGAGVGGWVSHHASITRKDRSFSLRDEQISLSQRLLYRRPFNEVTCLSSRAFHGAFTLHFFCCL